MARARNIKPGFFRNEDLADLDPLTRLLFAGLWTVADRAGRLEDRPRRIKADILPYDDGADVDAMLDALAARSFIARYKHGAARYIQIVNFDKHQNPHKNEAESTIPPMGEGEPVVPERPAEPPVDTANNPVNTGNPPEHRTSTVQAPESHSTNRADSLNSDSHDSGLLEDSAPEKPAQPVKPRTPKQIESDRKHQRRLVLFESYCRGLGIDPDGDEALVYRDRAFRELKPVVDKPAPVPDDLETCTRWMSLQSWRDQPPTITQVLGAFAGWASKGKPREPEESKPANTTHPRTARTNDLDAWRRKHGLLRDEPNAIDVKGHAR